MIIKAGDDIWVDSPPKLNYWTSHLEIVDSWMHGTVLAITKKGRVIVVPHGESIASAYITSPLSTSKRTKEYKVGTHSLNEHQDGLTPSEFIMLARRAIANRKSR